MPLKGGILRATRRLAIGWAWDDDRPTERVSVAVVVDGAVVGRALANKARPDLARQNIGDGRHAFELRFPTPLTSEEDHVVELRREADGRVLAARKMPKGPFDLDPGMRNEWMEVFASAETDEDFQKRLAFLLDETTKLRAEFARRRSGAIEKQERRDFARRLVPEGLAPPPPARPRALVIDSRTPDLTRDAGSQAIVSHMRSLQRLGFDVSFTASNMAGDPAALEALGVSCYLKGWVGSVEELLSSQRDAFSLVYLHREDVAACYLGLARRLQPRARIIYSVADLHHVRIARQAKVEGREELMPLAERMRRQELTSAAFADVVLTHSPAEAAILGKLLPSGKIVRAPWAVEPRPTKTPFAERRGVAFFASFGHAPNVDAAHLLVSDIMPEVWRRDPSIPCLIAGSETPESLRRLAGERVEILGHLPDLAALFERTRLTAAPLAFGAGIKGKVLESLSAGLPCVCTPIAAEGFEFAAPLADNVRTTAFDLAERIVAVHNDLALNTALRAAGLAYVEANNAAAAVDEALAQAAGVSA